MTRIIGGSAGGRRLSTPPGTATISAPNFGQNPSSTATAAATQYAAVE